MTKSLTIAAAAGILLLTLCGCAQKQVTFNKMICPTNYNEARIQADLGACHYYDLQDADKASVSRITIECKECLEKKGYTIEK